MNKTINEPKQHYSFILQPEESGQRLDKWLQLQLPDMTRSAVQKLIEQGNVTRNGMIISKNGKGNTGDVIEVIVSQSKPLEVMAQDIPLDILYEMCIRDRIFIPNYIRCYILFMSVAEIKLIVIKILC